MAEFGFTEAQELLRQAARRFAQRELVPGAKERATTDAASHKKAAREIYKKMAEAGWRALNAPARYGGQPVDCVSVGILCEEMSRVDQTVQVPEFSEATYLLGHLAQELQDEWFPPLISGDKTASYAFTEPDAGSDVSLIKTRAIRDGDYYIINGEKSCSSTGYCADVSVLSAKTDPHAGHQGITMFWLPHDLSGITKSPLHWMGHRQMGPTWISLEDVRLPAKYRIGDEGKGIYLVMGHFDWTRANLALSTLATAQSSLEEAMTWAKQRIAFGRPIAKFEGVSFKIVEHYTAVEAARMLCYKTLWLRDRGLPCTKEAAMAKWFGMEVAVRALHDCMILFGHVGYSEECPIEQRLRNAIGYEFASGTEQIQKIVIARELMGREAMPY